MGWTPHHPPTINSLRTVIGKQTLQDHIPPQHPRSRFPNSPANCCLCSRPLGHLAALKPPDMTLPLYLCPSSAWKALPQRDTQLLLPLLFGQKSPPQSGLLLAISSKIFYLSTSIFLLTQYILLTCFSICYHH